MNDFDGFNEYSMKNGINNNEIWSWREKIIITEDELEKCNYIYKIETRYGDCIGNIKVNGQTNFQFGYTSDYDMVTDYQHGMYLPSNMLSHATTTLSVCNLYNLQYKKTRGEKIE